MWYLTSENDTRIIYVFSPARKVVVGRSLDAQNCNFAISDDPSISRKHASLYVTSGKLYVEDLESRYGTFINNSSEKLDSNSKTVLEKNDVLKFGKLNSIWKVNEINFITCTSTLKGENLQKLKSSLGQLGGCIKNDWDDSCVYLTMPAITLTIKVVLALVQCSYIVTTDYWDKCVEAVNENVALPDPKHYIPEVIESTLNKENVSFLHNELRKQLFAGKKFIFFSQRQMDMYKMVLLKSSADTLLLSDTKLTKSMLCEDNIIVIQYSVTSASQEIQSQKTQINDITTFLKSRGKRVVADAEIGLAVLYCSCSKYCNPSFNFSSEIMKSSEYNEKKTNILAKETQESTQNICKQENIVIEESLNSTNSKRKLSEADSEMTSNALKKIATESNKIRMEENSKRKLIEDSAGNANKKFAVDNSENDDFFNFTTPINTSNGKENNANEKKLKFVKPIKRKTDSVNAGGGDLFNFVHDDSNDDATNKDFDIPEVEKHPPKKKCVYDLGDNAAISALRGVKLKELMESNISYIQPIKTVKQEITDELDSKMEKLDLGTTIVKIREDLIVKKEPIEIEDVHSAPVKNFKKFVKIWPIKMQVTIVPTRSKTVGSKANVDQTMSSALSVDY